MGASTKTIMAKTKENLHDPSLNGCPSIFPRLLLQNYLCDLPTLNLVNFQAAGEDPHTEAKVYRQSRPNELDCLKQKVFLFFCFFVPNK